MEQAASYRNDLQVACHATPIHESKNIRSGFAGCTRAARRDARTWGRLAMRRQLCYAIKTNRRLRKCLTIRKMSEL